jgi:hypothetical protein
MPVIRNPQLIKEVTILRYKGQVYAEVTVAFIVKRYFHYGMMAMMNGQIFASQMRFAIKMKYMLYSQIPKQFRKLFTYSSKLFGYTFLPVLENNYAKKFGYNLKPDARLLTRIAEFTDTDQIYKLVKK